MKTKRTGGKPQAAEQQKSTDWRDRLHETIYESNTPEGKAFDIALLICIVVSIAVVMLDSMPAVHHRYSRVFYVVEWSFTILFTLEYILRLVSIRKPWLYVTSVLGVIDLLAIIPSYLSIFYVGAQSLLVVRSLRLLRIFRIFKLTHFLSEMNFLRTAMVASLKKIAVFMLVVLTLVIILGSIMYLVEGHENGFNTIPDSIYWAIVTLTTVGYGDISPVTALGKFIASFIMFIGYGIIAVPTGIVTTEVVMGSRDRKDNHQVCPSCGREGHDDNARYCKWCGAKL